MKSIILAAAVLVAMTGVVHADARPKVHMPEQSEASRDIGQHEQRFPVRGIELFDRYDLNGDGVITRGEVKVVYEQRQRTDHSVGADKAAGSTQVNSPQQRHSNAAGQPPSPRHTDCFSGRDRK